MKKRILSALLTLGMVLTMLPTAWAVDGTYGPENDSIRIEIGDEITLTGTEGATHSWTYHAGNGYLDDGMCLPPVRRVRIRTKCRSSLPRQGRTV